MSPHDEAPGGTDLKKALALVAATALITAVLVGFVRLKSLQVEAGYRVHDLRMRLVTLEQQRAALDVERTALARPQRIANYARTVLGLTHVDASLAASPPAIAKPMTAAPLAVDGVQP